MLHFVVMPKRKRHIQSALSLSLSFSLFLSLSLSLSLDTHKLGRVGSLASLRQPVKKKENSKFKPIVPCFELIWCYILLVAEELGKYMFDMQWEGPLNRLKYVDMFPAVFLAKYRVTGVSQLILRSRFDFYRLHRKNTFTVGSNIYLKILSFG